MMATTKGIGAVILAVALLLGMNGLVAHTPVSAQEGDTAAAFSTGDDVVVFDGALNLRQEPGLETAVVVVLDDAAPLTITGEPQAADGVTWYPVSTADGNEGWVTSEFITSAQAEGAFAPGDAVVVDPGPLNLRDAAGTDAAVLDTLDEGTAASIVSGPTAIEDLNWYEIELENGDTGWVAGTFLADAAQEAAFTAGDVVVVADGPLNLRGGASINGTVLQTLDEGATATVVSGPTESGEVQWYQIEVEGETGWAAGAFLALAEGDLEPGTPAEPSDVGFPIGSFVFVNSEELNLRADAGIEADIVETLLDGAVATVLDGPVEADDFTWFQVSTGQGENALEGWVAGELLTGGIVLGIDAEVVDGLLNLRADASATAEALTQLEEGQIVNVVAGPTAASGVAWFEVTVDDETGFVAGRYLGSAA